MVNSRFCPLAFDFQSNLMYWTPQQLATVQLQSCFVYSTTHRTIEILVIICQKGPSNMPRSPAQQYSLLDRIYSSQTLQCSFLVVFVTFFSQGNVYLVSDNGRLNKSCVCLQTYLFDCLKIFIIQAVLKVYPAESASVFVYVYLVLSRDGKSIADYRSQYNKVLCQTISLFCNSSPV